MTAAGASLERRAFSLGAANAIDYALQFVLPIVLTRALDAEAFGHYRLLWLAVGTVMVIAPLFMPQSLYYYLPRSDRDGKRLYINQTLVFLAGMGVLAAWALSAWNPFLPGALHALVSGEAPLVPLFVLLWIVASLLDVLPTVDERVGWQARAIVGLSVLRSVVLAGVAIATNDFAALVWALLAFTVFKAALLAYYIARHHGLGGPWVRPAALRDQVQYAAPFGLGGMLHGLRAQADQWVAAALFTVTQFAALSIAVVLGPMVHLVRQSVNHVFLPGMSRTHATGDVRAVLDMNARANAMVAVLVYPALAFAFVFAEALITVVYTATYVEAAPVLRIYVIGLVVYVVELTSVLMLLKQGPFTVRVNGTTLALSIPLSLLGALHFGLPGAAIGSVSMIFLERAVSLRRIAQLTGERIGSLQDWAKLALLLASSAISAAVSGLVVHGWALGPLAALAAGGLCMAVTYPVVLCLTGQRQVVAGFLQSVAAPRAARLTP